MAGGVLEGRWYNIMDMTGAIGEGKFVTVIVLESLKEAGLGGDHVVHFEMIKQDLDVGRGTCRLG